jgi:outer membrane protein assembly factor BamB
MKNISSRSGTRLTARAFMAGVALSILATQTGAQVDAQWRGDNRDGIYQGATLLKKWPEQGLTLLLSMKDLGGGFSSPAVTKDRVYVTGMIDKIGYLFAFDLKGTLIWKSVYGPEWDRDYPGVRATPTIEGNSIYIESGKGRVACINAADGKEAWAVDMVAVFGAATPRWGFNESVLIDGNHLICTPGGSKASVAALDKATGKTLWSTKIDGIEESGYCSPVKIVHEKREILVTMTSNAIIGLDAVSGKFLWKYAHQTDYGINPNTPLYSHGNLICYSGYGQGAVMLKIAPDGMSITKVWDNPKFDVQIGAAVLIGNDLYGSGHKNKGWHCVDIQTGKIKYSSTEIGGGCVISAAGLLYCYSEKGTLSLVQPGADKFTVISTMPITLGSGTHWAHPVIANGRLYLRHGDTLMVYNLAN